MSLFDLVSDLAKIAVRTGICLPVAVAKDVVNWFDPYNNDESSTVKNLSKTVEEIEQLPNRLTK